MPDPGMCATARSAAVYGSLDQGVTGAIKVWGLRALYAQVTGGCRTNCVGCTSNVLIFRHFCVASPPGGVGGVKYCSSSPHLAEPLILSSHDKKVRWRPRLVCAGSIGVLSNQGRNVAWSLPTFLSERVTTNSFPPLTRKPVRKLLGLVLGARAESPSPGEICLVSLPAMTTRPL